MSLRAQIRDLAGFLRRTERSVHQHTREPVDHFVLLDGTMSSLAEGEETNIGLIYKLLEEVARSGRVSLYYEAGTQWSDWSKTLDVIEGRGINRRIRRAYGWLATRYRPGDRIFLIGYSRGAFAVRSLAGVIDRVGLLRQDEAIERLVQQAFRHYQINNGGEAREVFSDSHCWRDVQIEVIGCFDTVKSLGLRAPFVWKWSEIRHSFHNHQLGHHIRHGYHALALDETREAFRPILWECEPGRDGTVEQVWFRGSHSDIGGQLAGSNEARPLSNIPLTWMLERIERSGLPLPAGWQQRFPTDPDAPSVGTWSGWGKIFLARKKRVFGTDPSESVHPSAAGRSFLATEVREPVRS